MLLGAASISSVILSWQSKRYGLPEVTTQDIMLAFPKLTHTKQVEVKQIIDSILKLTEHRYRIEKYKVSFPL